MLESEGKDFPSVLGVLKKMPSHCSRSVISTPLQPRPSEDSLPLQHVPPPPPLYTFSPDVKSQPKTSSPFASSDAVLFYSSILFFLTV